MLACSSGDRSSFDLGKLRISKCVGYGVLNRIGMVSPITRYRPHFLLSRCGHFCTWGSCKCCRCQKQDRKCGVCCNG